VLAFDSNAAAAANNLAWLLVETEESLGVALRYAKIALAARRIFSGLWKGGLRDIPPRCVGVGYY
jgi:hypothetical protein